MYVIGKRAKTQANEFGERRVIMSAAPRSHMTEVEALKEANRLASAAKDFEYVVFKEIGFARSTAAPTEFINVHQAA